MGLEVLICLSFCGTSLLLEIKNPLVDPLISHVHGNPAAATPPDSEVPTSPPNTALTFLLKNEESHTVGLPPPLNCTRNHPSL